MSQTVFKSTEGLMAMDYAAIYREKHIKGMLDRRIMGDKEMVEEEETQPEPEAPVEPEEPVVVEESPIKSKYNRI